MGKRTHALRRRSQEIKEKKGSEAWPGEPCNCAFKEECEERDMKAEVGKNELKEKLIESGIWKEIVKEIGEKNAEEILEGMVMEMEMG